MREQTYQKFINLLKEIKESGLSVNQYYKQVAEKSSVNFYKKLKQIKEDTNPKTQKLRNQALSGYEDLKVKVDIEVVDNDQQSEISNVRDEEGKIIYYQYCIYKKNKPSLQGRLTKEEMNTIYRLYTYYGDNLTARVVSRYFPDFSLPDFKRILRAFNIYKDSGVFAPHMYEEYSENELRDIQLREKENSFLRKAEEDNIKNREKLLRKLGLENVELKKKLESLSDIKVSISELEPYYTVNSEGEEDSAINIYLSDIHLGADVETGALFKENLDYGFNEAKRRLSEVLDKVYELGSFDVVNICLMGDNIDCCGHKGYTASMTHQMPENMDPRDQFNKFIELYDWFIRSINENNIAEKKINVYSVPAGNHGGSYEFALNNTLKYYTEARFPNIKFTLFDQFFGVFKQNGISYVLTHGKNYQFMKRGLPLNIDDKNKVKIYEWLDDNKLYGDNIHIIKGDLHSNNMNSCKRFTYRNVLSLFGASDYSNYGFSRNSYGVSYDMMIGNNVLSGTIENV